MRAVGCAVQQSLSVEAAAVVKQAVALSKRRGHAQVTPLHVASTMLSSAAGLLRAACLQSNSHPLQCKALELCFNVALNRLPASSSSSVFGHHHPSISNALTAAFKRAQTHQRRGSIETNQPPTANVRIEVEQLIISILDDPSVSRVMKEAGFSSTQVKANVEKSVGLQKTEEVQGNGTGDADVGTIITNLLTSRKRKSLVLVGECISKLEAAVKELMNRVDNGDVAEDFRDLQFISIPPLHSFFNLDRDLVQRKMEELACLVKSRLVRNGVVLYLGDFNWISQYHLKQDNCCCSIEHAIAEIGKLVSGIGENERFWLVGIATFETYVRCRNKNGCNSLESIWGLHPLTLGSSNSLSLTLISDSGEQNRYNQLQMTNGGGKLRCCTTCSTKCPNDAGNPNTSQAKLSSLPSWPVDGSTPPNNNNNNENHGSVKENCEIWDSDSNTSGFSFDQKNPNQLQNLLCYCNTFTAMEEHKPNSESNSPSASAITETAYTQIFKEFNAHNLNILCDALEKKVPWQRNIIPEIAGTVLQCRSKMLQRKSNANPKEETWLFFLGPDVRAKEKISMELARVVFGSYSSFVAIGSSGLSMNEECCGSKYVERFGRAASTNPHCVFLLEDFERLDCDSIIDIKRAIENGSISWASAGGEVSLCDAIIVFSGVGCCSGAESRSPPLDLNISFDETSFENESVEDLGILQSVDWSVFFQLQSL